MYKRISNNSKKRKNKNGNVQYRINSKGEKRRILFSIPLISMIAFWILLHMLTTEIYCEYNQVDMNDVIKNFDIHISKMVIEDLNDKIYDCGIKDFDNSSVNNQNNLDSNKIKNTNVVKDFDLNFSRRNDDILKRNEDSNHSNSEDTVTSEKISQNNYITSSGEKYHIIANLKISSLDIDYPILSETSDDLLKISLTKYWGANPNQVGNMVVLGHNYESKKFFSKLHQIQKGAKIQVTDLSGKTLQYTVYDTLIIDPYDNSCTSQLTNGKTEITLITCYNRDANRFVVKARAE